MNRVIFILATSLFGIASAAEFIHPGDFTGSQTEKDAVVAYIVEQTKLQYSAIGMDDPMTLRMMEKENLVSFQQLTTATNRPLLDSVIKQYCAIGMCDYQTINMMYNEQNRAASPSLSW
ncbi:hypothetical protein [Reinekea thalattae]|uniref:Uncharacterized protein n=1 Tax=Reinekea thalattae TaxID=2593301 RepID=A0A5C8Z629_9GAMM|nr:hypothetical protein [Reinekea thalattae]TXR53565.1 hypothetical protein FME95_03075 [Reinekea thalattae]